MCVCVGGLRNKAEKEFNIKILGTFYIKEMKRWDEAIINLKLA